MYAIFSSGGKQHKVSVGEFVDVELLRNEVGDLVEFDSVMYICTGQEGIIGAPFIKGALIKTKVVGTSVGKKLIFYRYKRRKGYRRKQGHKQSYSRLEVLQIEK